MNYRSTLARLGAVGLSAGLITLYGAGAASAHVTVTASETGAGAYTVLTFSVPHGCDGSPTTKIAIQVPESITEATPTRNPYYGLQLQTAKLDKPLKAEDGDEITERTSAIVYTAQTPLPADERDTFEVSLQLPDTAGETVAFPVIQTCQKGQTAWTEVPAAGQSEDDLEHPAPAVAITEAGTEDAAASGDGASVSDAAPSATPASAKDDDDGNGLAVAGLVAGILGLLAGAAALARSGRKA